MRIVSLALTLTLSSLSLEAQRPAAPAGEWRHYSSDSGSTKYSPLDQINASNVASLKIAWRRPQVDPALVAANGLKLSNNFRATPIMVGGVLYHSNGIGLVEAVEPSTGKTIWTQQPLGTGAGALLGASNRGVAFWRDGAEARLMTFRNEFLFALDPATGDAIPTFGDGGKVNLTEGLGPLLKSYRWNGSPLIVRDMVVLGSSMADQDSATRMEGAPGDVRAYDVRTGKLRWTFHVVPREGEFGTSSWENESWRYTGAGNVWSLMSADEETGYVYLPTSSVTNDMYGGHRLGSNLFSSSVVCIDSKTGKRVWHFQTVHHDLFDFDNPAAPILADITVGGRRIKAVIQVTKQSYAYVFDRITGKPVWPIDEKPAPRATAPGDKASPTQPIPSKPPPFDRQGISIDDLIDFTPELRAEAIEISKRYVIGPLFTPPSVKGDGPNDTKGTIQLPGSVGGADWTGAAFDPETGVLYVPSMTRAFAADLIPGDPKNTNLRYRAGTRRTVEGPQGLPLTKPPYGRVTALDLNRGEQVWMVANGDGPRHHPLLKHLNLPPLGQAVRSAAIVTKALLFVGEGDQINIATAPNGGGRKFRALDKKTGTVLWEVELEAGSTGAPMTYLHNGKQFLVFAIGGVDHPAEFVAFSLP